MHEFTYITAFTVGLMGGVHCIGMCGGIVGALSFAVAEGKTTHWLRITVMQLAYNLGRIFSYTLAGALMGGIGWLVTAWGDIQLMQRVLQFFAALFMLLMGLYISGWWMGLNRIEKLGARVWQYIQPLAQKQLPVKSFGSALVLGCLWGWLPCGLVYSVLVWSVSAGNMLDGALLMLSFALGTLPNLLAMGLFAHQIKSFMQHAMVRRLAGATVIAFALWGFLQVFTSLSSVRVAG